MFNYQNITKVVEKYLTFMAMRFSLFTKKYDKLNSQLEIALTKWPNDFDTLRLAQEIYRDTNNQDAFFDIYTRVEKLYPNKLQLRRNLGTAFLASHRYSDAAEQFEYCVGVRQQLFKRFCEY